MCWDPNLHLCYLDHAATCKGQIYDIYYKNNSFRHWFYNEFFKREEITTISRIRSIHYNLAYNLYRKSPFLNVPAMILDKTSIIIFYCSLCIDKSCKLRASILRKDSLFLLSIFIICSSTFRLPCVASSAPISIVKLEHIAARSVILCYVYRDGWNLPPASRQAALHLSLFQTNRLCPWLWPESPLIHRRASFTPKKKKKKKKPIDRYHCADILYGEKVTQQQLSVGVKLT